MKAIEKANRKDNTKPKLAAKKNRKAAPKALETIFDSKSVKPAIVPVDRQNSKSDPENRNINVRYTRTKIQANDPAHLKDKNIITFYEDLRPTNEIKMLQTRILKKLEEKGGNSLLIVSANPYEGKTFTSINLGVSIAREVDKTVLIIDADLRKPSSRHCSFSTDFFYLEVEKGLSDYLKGDADIPDILINPGIHRLTVIPSGKPLANAPELLNSDQMKLMMNDIKSRYPSDRLVIVDSPPMLKYPDALILTKYVDGILLVVESESTKTDDLKKMEQLLIDLPVLGTVFNKAKD